ncbi:MAG TPA: SynChlorMet cassette radical SAM/SPASM protein ScmF [Thermodesulfovibrionales bacterium]|nr:SynChlorMet cassette radical SAM/SPASM protein ScmF [Thermodesulfovibrionales bacterium]
MTLPVDGKQKAARAVSIPPIRQLYFYLTEGCNLACRHCWLAPRLDTTGSRYPVLPVELFETAIREARPFGLSAVKLTGGEPLLHPQFTRLLEIVRREGLGLRIETNGMLCSPETAAEIAKSPKPFVSVSIDGIDAATHDRVRGIEGSFQAAIRAVRNLVAVGIRSQIIFTVMRSNAGQVDAMVSMAEKMGADSVKFNVVQPTARGERLHEKRETLSVAELITLGRHVDRELAPITKLRLFFDYPQAFLTLSRIANGDGRGVCGISTILGVLAIGRYALCGIGEQVPDLVFGEVGKDQLEEVWQGHPVLTELRTGLPGRLEGICALCLMKSRCLGSCVAQNYYTQGRFWAPFWFCEQAHEAGLFPTSRMGTKSAPGRELIQPC